MYTKKKHKFNKILLFITLVIGNSCATVEEPLLSGTVTDIDGNTYQTVTIKNHTWMIENLRTTHLNDNTPIPLLSDSAAWATADSTAYCWYNNDKETAIGNNYGALYNWRTINSGALAPKGWHVATANDWKVLESTVSNYYFSSGSLPKILASTILWQSSSVSGSPGNNKSKNNASKFNGMPCGYRNYKTAAYSGSLNSGRWWTATVKDSADSWMTTLEYNSAYVNKLPAEFHSGLSVRCVKDSI